GRVTHVLSSETCPSGYRPPPRLHLHVRPRRSPPPPPASLGAAGATTLRRELFPPPQGRGSSRATEGGVRGSGVDGGREDADGAQVAVALGVVEAVAHHEVVRDVEPDVLDVDVDLRRLRLAQQGADLHRRRAPALE